VHNSYRLKRVSRYRVGCMKGIYFDVKPKREGKEEFQKIDMSVYNKYMFSMYETDMCIYFIESQ